MRVNQVILPGIWHTVTPLFYGKESCCSGHTYGPAVRDCYLLHYVLEGKGTFIRGDGRYPVATGDIFVIRPGEVTTYQADTQTPWSYVWLGFSCNEELPFLQEAVLRQMPVKHMFAYIGEHIEMRELDGKIFSLTHELLWTLSRNTDREQKPGSRYAEYLKVYMDNSYMNRISIEEVAERLHVDRRYLTALFRERYGQPPQSYLIELRLEKADGFLREGYSVTDAAVMSGFSDLSNFSCRYKSRYGISPSRRGGRKAGIVSNS